MGLGGAILAGFTSVEVKVVGDWGGTNALTPASLGSISANARADATTDAMVTNGEAPIVSDQLS